MKKLVIGILAHVDAGKTTLSEALLYQCGTIRSMGRVDKGNAFLDTDALERTRGITIFSKQAVLQMGESEVTLLDTPGHVDFSAEMERALQVLDYAILVISGADGVQGHTLTLWKLLNCYHIPTFLFINKMDQNDTDRESLLAELKQRLDDGCVDFSLSHTESFYEQIALTGEAVLEKFLETNVVPDEDITELIAQRKVYPCFFGSALKLMGVDLLIDGIVTYTKPPLYQEAFGAQIFKITRDEQGNRLTHMKITGGSLKVKMVLPDVDEKVNQIRCYSGEKYISVDEVHAGSICAVPGLEHSLSGQGIGLEAVSFVPILEPVLSYRVLLPDGCDVGTALPKLRQIEEEDPKLHIVWEEELKEIQAQIMGEVQLQVLQSLISERFGLDITFGSGRIVYKETITDCVEGVGHFEPLRHYAEVHLLLEPGEPGSGLQFCSSCSEDDLDRNWQRLILTHLEEKDHKGVLTGSSITDMKITLAAGRAHKKHTEGGDFRQATYRAVRQGLMQAKSVLLEPYYEFRIEVPEAYIGRAMTDIERMEGIFDAPYTEHGMAILEGSAPVANMQGYQKELIAYTKGLGRLSCSLKGYAPCHNEGEILKSIGYEPERDLDNPAGSVFCSHGAGFVVAWNHVKEHMHVESQIPTAMSEPDDKYKQPVKDSSGATDEKWIDIDEINQIFARTFHANKKDKSNVHKWSSSEKKIITAPAATNSSKKTKVLDEYLLVDGYNVIYAWDDLKELAEINIDGAKGKLLDILCNYQGIRKCTLIVVFDAYRLKQHAVETLNYHNILVVYTAEAETADHYIETFAHKNKGKYQITVATSDYMEQIITMGQGCALLSAREFKKEIELAAAALWDEYAGQQTKGKAYLFDSMSKEAVAHIQDMIKDEQ